MYTIIGKIDNFDRKKSYKGFEKQQPIAAQAVKVNKCVVNTTVRKKRSNTIPLKEAKAVYKASLMTAK